VYRLQSEPELTLEQHQDRHQQTDREQAGPTCVGKHRVR
jgi:hypothetical protein